MNKVAFFTVVFPGVERYLDDFLSSLSRQSMKDFDLFIFNDGLALPDHYLKSHIDGLNYNIITVKGSPAKIREQGINSLIEHKYEKIIFGDSDDYFSQERVEKSVDLLSFYDVVVNELCLVTHDGELIESNYLSNRLKDNQLVDLPYILEKNVFGLSNSAINTRNLEKVSLPDYTVAVDWFLFSCILRLGRKAVFTKSATTYYRQHGSNTIGIQKFSRDQLLRGVQVKSRHYKALAEIDDQYLLLRNSFEKLEQQLDVCPESLELLYQTTLEKDIKNPLWWEQILLPEILWKSN